MTADPADPEGPSDPSGSAGLWQAALDEYLTALADGDRAHAMAVVRRLRRDGAGLLDVLGRVLAPAQLQVGVNWLTDSWSVAQEHAATAISEAVVHALAAEQDERPDRRRPGQPLVVVSCAEQEWHALPALLVAEHLREAGVAVSYLGANASSPHLVRHVHELGPRAVLLSCSLGGTLPVVRRQVEAVRETGTPVVVGGAAFDSAGRRAAALGATAYAPDGVAVTAVLPGLPDAVSPAPPLTGPGATEGYLVFGDREQVADRVSRTLLDRLGLADPAGTDAPWLRVLDDQLPHLVGSVAGALVCDDPSVLADALDWAETVLAHRQAPAEVGTTLRGCLADALHDMPAATTLLADLTAA